MNNQLPLIFSAYYLDFSYPGQFNAETRAFINIPCADQVLQKNKEINFLSICFEMNSVFDKEGYFDKQYNVDNGLKVMLKTNKIIVPNFNDKKLLTNLELKDADINQIYIYDEEFGLYKNIVSKFENFLINAYSDNWIDFYSQKRKEFNEKYEVTQNNSISTNDERNKLDKFIMQSVDRLQKILIQDLYDERVIKHLNLSYTNNELTNVFNTNLKDNITPVDELLKIAKRNSYFELKNELDIKNESKQKNFKL